MRYVIHVCVLCAHLLHRGRFFATAWIVACQAPLSMGFLRQEYWSGLPFPVPGGFPWPRDWNCVSCMSCIGRQICYWCITWEAPCTIHKVEQKCFVLASRDLHSDSLHYQSGHCRQSYTGFDWDGRHYMREVYWLKSSGFQLALYLCPATSIRLIMNVCMFILTIIRKSSLFHTNCSIRRDAGG